MVDIFEIPRLEPARLHAMARRVNWDIDQWKLEVAVEQNPRCALGTALLIYWRGRPHWFRQYANYRAAPSHERALFSLLRKIEDGIRAGRFPLEGIAHDPRSELTGLVSFDYPDVVKVRDLPPHVRMWTDGREIHAMDAEGEAVLEMVRAAAAGASARNKAATERRRVAAKKAFAAEKTRSRKKVVAKKNKAPASKKRRR